MFAAIVAFLVTNYILCISAYVGGGAVYALIKWTLTMIKIRRLVLAQPEVKRESIVSDVLGDYTYPPKVSENKGNLLMWASFWPFNLVWTLFADVAKEAWSWIYNRFGAMLQAITNSILPK
jgi:hypothetical protein